MIPIFFFFNDTATTEIYTLSLHDALPISRTRVRRPASSTESVLTETSRLRMAGTRRHVCRSEEHTSELQSQSNLVCRLLLEKKKKDMSDRELTSTSLSSDVTEAPLWAVSR